MSFYCLTHNANSHLSWNACFVYKFSGNGSKECVAVLFAGHDTKAHCVYWEWDQTSDLHSARCIQELYNNSA